MNSARAKLLRGWNASKSSRDVAGMSTWGLSVQRIERSNALYENIPDFSVQ